MSLPPLPNSARESQGEVVNATATERYAPASRPLASTLYKKQREINTTTMMWKVCLLCLSLTVSSVQAWQVNQIDSTYIRKRVAEPASKAFMSAVLSTALVLLPPSQAMASSDTAAQVTLQSLPPKSINVQIKDLPVVGKLLSGTYSKVPDNVEIAKPSIVIKSPTDKTKAIQNLVKNGHLEFDVSGTVNTHLDIDVAADKAKVMSVRVASDLIPKLPFKNLASSSQSSPTGGKESAWNMVTNMGSGETYYYNEKTGLTQYERPAKF